MKAFQFMDVLFTPSNDSLQTRKPSVSLFRSHLASFDGEESLVRLDHSAIWIEIH